MYFDITLVHGLRLSLIGAPHILYPILYRGPVPSSADSQPSCPASTPPPPPLPPRSRRRDSVACPVTPSALFAPRWVAALPTARTLRSLTDATRCRNGRPCRRFALLVGALSSLVVAYADRTAAAGSGADAPCAARLPATASLPILRPLALSLIRKEL